MPGDGACRGYVRWACTHGVPLVREPGCECEQGCTECRMTVSRADRSMLDTGFVPSVVSSVASRSTSTGTATTWF
eukprot:626005-Prymnesium_polylepis.1